MWQSREVRFAMDHPTAAGHFPGNPVLPGALLLDEVVKAVAEPDGEGSEIVIRSAKFFRPVRPGETVLVRWESRPSTEVKFECRLAADDDLAVAGILQIGGVPRDR
jgi:3-hydroxymyristoyl/3-hydroxydecanoyl-(acyl carrier protein) dehydratase